MIIYWHMCLTTCYSCPLLIKHHILKHPENMHVQIQKWLNYYTALIKPVAHLLDNPCIISIRNAYGNVSDTHNKWLLGLRAQPRTLTHCHNLYPYFIPII